MYNGDVSDGPHSFLIFFNGFLNYFIVQKLIIVVITDEWDNDVITGRLCVIPIGLQNVSDSLW